LQCISTCPPGKPASVNCAACVASNNCLRCIAGWKMDLQRRCTVRVTTTGRR
jgi:hypothetical protein